MTTVPQPPLSPSIPLPSIGGLGAEDGKPMGPLTQGGEYEFVCGVCNVGEEDGSFDAEDVQPQQTLRTPELPSRSVIEEHRIDHCPYRCWCDECVEGFGRERGHGRADNLQLTAVISMDYMFETRKGVVVKQNEEGWDHPEALKILVVKDSKSKAVFAHAVPKKGVDDKRYSVDKVVEDVLYLGYSKVLLKSDNEPAIIKLLKESLGSLKVTGDIEQAGEEHSTPYDSQSNGAVEAAVKQVRGRIRTMKLCLERRIGKRIPPKHPIMAWLVPHTAAIIRLRARGTDGKTPYERIRMRPFNGRLICFGEKCRFKNRAKEQNEDEHRFHQGIFLGLCPLTGQYILHDVEKAKVKYARTIMPLPDEHKWNMTNIESIRATPYDEHAGIPGEVVFQDRPEQPGDQDVPKKIKIARKMYIKAEDFGAVGRTVGCPKCDYEARYGRGRTDKARPTMGHSDACKARIIEELKKTPEGLRRVANAEERINRTIAEQIENQEPHGHWGGRR